MSDSSKDAFQISQLDLIESLVKKKKFKEALAEIREREIQNSPDRFSREWGWFSHLASKALRGVGRCEEALKKALEAAEIFKNTPENERLAQIQFNLGVIYSDLGDLRSSELQFRDAASTYRRVEDKKGVIRTYSELSRIYFTRARYDRAIECLNEAVECCRRTRDQRLTATVLGNLGTVYMISDRWEKARLSLSKSLELNKKCKREINVCNSYLSLGYLSILLREFSKAQDHLKCAYQIIYENSYGRELAIYHEYCGSLEFARGDLEAAHDHFREAIRIGEQIAPKSAIMSQAHRLMAELLAEKGKHEQALLSCEKSIRASKDIGERLEEAVNYRTLGRLCGQNGCPDKVKQNYAQAIQVLEEIGAKFELAKTYLNMGQCDSFEFWERMKFLGRAEDLASTLDSSYYLAEVHAAFARLFFKNHKFAAAQDFLGKAKAAFEQSGEKKDSESLSALEKQIKEHLPATQPVSAGSRAGAQNSDSDAYSADIVTRDKAILEILKNAQQVKDLDVTILLEGETGTGKDLLAKVIHHTSIRKNNRFVVVSCAALPEALFESELFGHKKGAFTGAVSDKKGLLDEAREGTVYLDEIAEVPLPIQVKLLRAIEEKEVVRIGEVKPRKVDFRVIAATNKDLDELVQEGKFRSDLFYRLNVVRFKLPPLRERKEDIPLLAEHALKKWWAEQARQESSNGTSNSLPAVPALDPKIMELFLNYHWPGNVRELENEVKRLLISSRGEDKISFEHLAGCKERLTNGDSSQPTSLLAKMAKYEKEQIEKALAETNGVKTKAARRLNIDEATLRYKMKKYDITVPK